ncbi:MAG: sodium/solute symporter [bacterium]
MFANLSSTDNIVILLYFAVVLGIGIFSAQTTENNSKHYFLAGKTLGWFAVGASLFTTNISSEHLVGLAGAGSARGLSVGTFEWMAVFILFIFGWIFAPIFIRANVYTMPEFLGKRFDDRSRIYLTTISIAAYIFTKIAVTLIAAGFLLSNLLGLSMFTSTVFIVLVTGFYTVIGGLNSVVRTQVFQLVILIFGATLLTFFSIDAVGGIPKLIEKLPHEYFNILKPSNDPDFPWTGILFGAPILGIWYWCTDQYIVQRILAARNITQARKGVAFTAFMKLFPIFLLIIPGLVAVVLYPDIKGDEAYAFLLSGDILPAGIKGFVIAGLFAAMMSSLSSAFNSSATLIVLDLFKPRRPNASENELVLVGRLTTTIIVLLAIGLIPLLKMLNQYIYIYLQNIQAFISPPIVVVFIAGMFWKRATSRAAIWTLMIGGLIGIIRILISFINPEIIASVPIINNLNGINYLHFAIILFVLSGFLIIVISLAERVVAIKDEKLVPSEMEIKGIKIDSSLTNQYNIELTKK